MKELQANDSSLSLAQRKQMAEAKACKVNSAKSLRVTEDVGMSHNAYFQEWVNNIDLYKSECA